MSVQNLEQNDGDFIEAGDVLEEVPDDGDHPMDDEEDDGGLEMEVVEGEGEGDDDEAGGERTDTSIQQFLGHRQSVFTIATHPTQPIAVSGGEDDLGYIWDLTTGEEILKLEGHSDSVTSSGFSTDGELVATAGMDGKVRVWKHVGEGWKNWEFLTELLGPDEVMWLQWHPKGNVLLAGSNDSTVWLWQLPSGNTMQVFAGHVGPVQCGQFTPDGKRIVTAAQDGTLILWDPRSPTPVFKLSPSDARFALEGGIISLAVNAASTVAVVGGAEGGVRVVSLSKGEVTGALDGHKEGESVEAISFVELTPGAPATAGGGVVVTGGTDGKICVWDLATMRLRTTLQHADAITALLTHPSPNGHILTSASSDKTLKTWNARTGELLKTHEGHVGPVLGAALGVGADGEVLAVGAGDDGVCLVFGTA